MDRRSWRPRTLQWRIRLLVSGVLLLWLVSVIAAAVVQAEIASSRARSATYLRPAQITAARLAESYVDQETGVRGYLLTRDPNLLQPYDMGTTNANRDHDELVGELVGDPQSLQLLANVGQAAAAWRAQVVEHEITQAQAGTLSQADLIANTQRGQQLFDALRTQLSAFSDRVDQLVANQAEHSQDVQSTGSRVTIAAAVVAVLLGLVTIIVLRTSLNRPLNRLVAQVRRVAGGDLGYSVDATGPAEVTDVAAAVESMRVRIIDESARAAETQQRLARYDEAEQIARNLNSTVVSRLFTTSMGLQSAASRYPTAAPALLGAVGDLDHAIRELQSAIFGLAAAPSRAALGERVLDLVSESERSLGFSPKVRLEGTFEEGPQHSVADELVAMLRDVLAGMARRGTSGEVEIGMWMAGDRLRLSVSGDLSAVPAGTGAKPDAELAGLAERTASLGGTCTVRQEPDGVVIDWDVPAGDPV